MIPFTNLQRQYRALQPEIDAAIQRVLESGQFVLGEDVAEFEREFAAYCGVRHAVAVNSGTSALHLALLAAGVGPGDEVITVPFTFVATVSSILYTGARPLFVDIDPISFTIDVDRIPAAITSRTKAIIPVHLYGQPADMGPILEIAGRYGLAVIEDAAQAHGATYHGTRVGALGDIGCFSFYPGKNLGAYGEAGCVTTDNPNWARKLRMMRNWGCEQRYLHQIRGFNYRMEAMQGAVLRVKLRQLDSWNEVRRKCAAAYHKRLSQTGLILPRTSPNRQHVYHVFAIRALQRDELRRRLQEDGIETGIHYPLPIHCQTAYADLGYSNGDFPVSERVAKEELSLPIFPELTISELETVCLSIEEALCNLQAI